MPHIRLNPNVRSMVVDVDWHDEPRDPAGFRTRMARDYESGAVILLKNAPFSVDFDLLNRVSFPAGRRFQKLSERFLCYPKVYKPEIARLFWDTFGTKPGLYLAFRNEVQRVSAEIKAFLLNVFNTYDVYRGGVSWRFTPTGPEGLHVDYFKPVEDISYLRLFMNIDKEPRVWGLSHPLEELIDRNRERLKLSELRGRPSNELVKRLNEGLLYGMSHLPPEESDRHIIEFNQGDVWICETRLNSHQIVAGNRLAATDLYVRSSSLQDPSRSVERRVAARLGQPDAMALAS